MTENETVIIMDALKTAYPSFYRDVKHSAALQTVALWHRMFAEDDGAVVSAAVSILIKTRTEAYPPSIGEVAAKVRELSRGDGELTGLEAWNLVAKACQNGIYGSKEEFARLPPAVRKAVGSPGMLREWAVLDPTSFSVMGAEFRRSYETLLRRDRDAAMLPPEVRARLEGTRPELAASSETAG